MPNTEYLAYQEYEREQQLDPKCRTPLNCWIDWFCKGYRQANRDISKKTMDAFCATMQEGPTGCDRNKLQGCQRPCQALLNFRKKINDL